MIEPDASERECVGTAHEPDASDAFDASKGSAIPASGEALDRTGSPKKKGAPRSRARRERVTSAVLVPKQGALLDSLSSLASFESRESTGDPGDATDAFDRRVPCEVFHAVWSALDAYRGAPLDLVSLTLTSPNGEDITEAAVHFANDIAHDAGGGVLVARDTGVRAAHVHFHGLVLTPDRARLRDLWCELAGAEAPHACAIPITGWKPLTAPNRESTFARNLLAVLWYAFKSWRVQHGRRSLDTDVITSGIFSAPWRAARAALDAPPVLGSDRFGKASGKHRDCQRCGATLPVRKRSHARWCSASCRSAAWEMRHRGGKGARKDPGSARNDAG